MNTNIGVGAHGVSTVYQREREKRPFLTWRGALACEVRDFLALAVWGSIHPMAYFHRRGSMRTAMT
jgi:hypothetical protein